MSSIDSPVMGVSSPLRTSRLTFFSRFRMNRPVRRFLKHRLAVTGAAVLLLLVILAILAPILAPYPPAALDMQNVSSAPSAEHLLGTDALGRDILSRALYGARVSLSVGFLAVLVYMIIGCVLGATAGFVGGRTDAFIMRLTEVVMCFPTLVLTLILVGILGASIFNVMFVIGLFGWPGVARLIRAQVLQLKNEEFILAATIVGSPGWRILIRHILPNTVGPLAVAATLGVGGAILQESALSFLGLGVVQPTPSWGAMLNEARNPSLLARDPWLWITPGGLISLTILAVNFIGDGMRDALDVRGKADI